MPSIQAKMISGLFKLIGVNRMLDKQGADFEKLLESYKAPEHRLAETLQSTLKVYQDILTEYDASSVRFLELHPVADRRCLYVYISDTRI